MANRGFRWEGVGQRPVIGTWRRWLGLLMLFGLAVWVAAAWLSSPGRPEAAVFSVPVGAGARQVADGLKEGGFVRSRTVFLHVLKSSGLAGKIQPGRHDLSGVRSLEEMVDRLVSGALPAEEMEIRILEGWGLREIRAEMERIGHRDFDSLFDLTGAPAEGYRNVAGGRPAFLDDYPFLDGLPDGVSLEGYLFPDTYRIFVAASPESTVRKLLDNFARRLEGAGLTAELESSGRSLHEVLTVASLLEKEVRGHEDRRLVADIFRKRLQAGMGLQADSTVNYVTGKSDPSARYDDLSSDSPYNTYRYRGLPPGPICNPGLDAIRAALDPAPNGYWYFLTDPEGKVHYAADFAGHQANRARYLR